VEATLFFVSKGDAIMGVPPVFSSGIFLIFFGFPKMYSFSS